MGLQVIILAAGKGTRMMSDIPKVLHKLAGIAMLERVVRTASSLEPKAIHVIYGSGGDTVREQLSHMPVNWIEQKEQLGTGHAVMQALPAVDADDQVLVLYGDVPLISAETLNKLAKETPQHGLGIVVTEVPDPSGLGRIVRNEMGNIVAIIEHKDANEQQLKINEINTGIVLTSGQNLHSWLPTLKNNNAQGEYYLTDIVSLAVSQARYVGGVMAHCTEEVQGVNDRWQLANLENYYQYQMAKQLTLQGVTVMDIHRVYVRGDIDIDKDVLLDINVMLEGQVKIGSMTRIGPNVLLKDCDIASNVKIGAHSILEGVVVHEGCEIGPFARVRPGTVLKAGSKVGNFVEVKNTTLGEGSKASHLAYLGDAEIGAGVNVGAGTITCNYDGINKHKTTIGDGAFIGSNSSLVAPVTIGEHATIGAGSTITSDTPNDQLTVARAKQRSISGWSRPKKPKLERKINRKQLVDLAT